MIAYSLIKEDLIQYVWKTKKYDSLNLITDTGEAIEIIHHGYLNSDAGPDFMQARLKINNTEWVGSVEMHVLSSQWYQHKHHMDDAYGGVILHVVYENDKDVYRKDGTRIPCIELKNRIPDYIRRNYLYLQSNDSSVPCAGMISKVSSEKISFWLQSILIERIERKVKAIIEIFNQNNQDWEQTAFILLSRYMGSRVNVLPFEVMARSIDIQILYKNRDNPILVEALLFGQAGLLESHFKDEYPNQLKQEYRFLQKKYSLMPIDPAIWKFSKLRPAHFPTIRLAQLNSILCHYPFLFRKLISEGQDFNIMDLQTITIPPYWHDHYRFDVKSTHKKKTIGKDLLKLLQINVIAPLMFFYGMETGLQEMKDKAIKTLENTPGENNKVIRMWKELGISSENAARSQALIQLMNEYCRDIQCLRCSIGHEVLTGR